MTFVRTFVAFVSLISLLENDNLYILKQFSER